MTTSASTTPAGSDCAVGVLFVPVVAGPHWDSVRWFRDPLGARTAVAFTSVYRLRQTLGPRHSWATMSGPSLRDLAADQGISQLTIDPTFSAPGVHPLLVRNAAASCEETTASFSADIATRTARRS